MNYPQTKQTIIDFIKNQVGTKPAVIGLSGGLDSALVAYLATEALGSEKMHGFILPSSSNTPAEIERANLVATNLGIKTDTFSIEPIVESFKKNTNLFTDTLALGNLKARIRMSILYGQANKLGGLVLGTGNKSELMAGYFTKYGDAGVDILPIASLYKTEVRELAKHLGVPTEIIDAPPTAGLWVGQTDEEELGITYSQLDKILMAMEEKQDLSNFDNNEVKIVEEMIKRSNHKRNLPPICQV